MIDVALIRGKIQFALVQNLEQWSRSNIPILYGRFRKESKFYIYAAIRNGNLYLAFSEYDRSTGSSNASAEKLIDNGYPTTISISAAEQLACLEDPPGLEWVKRLWGHHSYYRGKIDENETGKKWSRFIESNIGDWVKWLAHNLFNEIERNIQSKEGQELGEEFGRALIPITCKGIKSVISSHPVWGDFRYQSYTYLILRLEARKLLISCSTHDEK